MPGPVVGLCFSQRKLGNTELMAKEALNGAREAGAEVKLFLARRLQIKPCRGCLNCVTKGLCPLDDDAPRIIEALNGASGLILACPVYFLTPSASLKLLVDRFLMLSEWLGPAPPRFAGVIGTAGHSDWAGLLLPFLNIMPLMLRMRILGSMLACAPGPGETLLDADNVKAIRDLGKRVGMAALGQSVEPDPVPANACPVCRSTFFEPRPDGSWVCPVCDTKATMRIQNGLPVFTFDPDSILHHRFTEERMKEHIKEWVQMTAQRFFANRDRIKELAAPYRDLDYEVGLLT